MNFLVENSDVLEMTQENLDETWMLLIVVNNARSMVGFRVKAANTNFNGTLWLLAFTKQTGKQLILNSGTADSFRNSVKHVLLIDFIDCTSSANFKLSGQQFVILNLGNK